MKIIHNEESFRFIAISGNKGRQFQVTPAHAKRIKMLLEREIEEYEETNGEIEASLPDNGEEKVTESFGPGFSQG